MAFGVESDPVRGVTRMLWKLGMGTGDAALFSSGPFKSPLLPAPWRQSYRPWGYGKAFYPHKAGLPREAWRCGWDRHREVDRWESQTLSSSQRGLPFNSRQAGGRTFQTAGRESAKFQRQESKTCRELAEVGMVAARIQAGCPHDYSRIELTL